MTAKYLPEPAPLFSKKQFSPPIYIQQNPSSLNQKRWSKGSDMENVQNQVMFPENEGDKKER